MFPLRPELRTYSRACERLLFHELSLTEEERAFVAYYVHELTQKYDLYSPALHWRDTAAVLRRPHEP